MNLADTSIRVFNRCLDNDEEIDLLNVAFEQRVASDSRQSATAKKPQECEDKLSRDRLMLWRVLSIL